MMTGYGAQHFVSWHNFIEPSSSDGRRFIIHDVTLRDGEQQAGVLFTKDEKIQIARAFDSLGVDRIEAGMVAVSEEDRQTIRTLVDMDLRAEIWTIARSIRQDVEQAVAAGVAGVGIIILANEQYCKVFGWTVEEAIEKALAAAELAKANDIQTTLLIADSSRMTRERLTQIVTAANSSEQYSAIALMDTFGALNPEGTRHLVEMVRAMTPLTIELHPHNDFGLGTANAIAGLQGGADVIHTSVIGLGERVGNTPLEELTVTSKLLYNFQHNVDLTGLCNIADLVQRCSGVTVAANKPVVGKSYSQIESGTVATEFSRLSAAGEDLQWLFPFQPSLVGAPDVALVVGKGAGLANIDAVLSRLGTNIDDAAKRDLLAKAKERSIALHRILSDEEVRELAIS